MKTSVLIMGCAVMVAGCAHTAAGPSVAKAQMKDLSGGVVGEATVRSRSAGLRVLLQAQGLTPGPHGVHVHAVGKCEAPGFTGAGGHWNPTGKQHGKDNPAGMHQGDLPNMTVGSDGRGSIEFMIDGASLAELLDADGAAVVVHATADDYKTDPSGNSGGRIACGVLTAS